MLWPVVGARSRPVESVVIGRAQVQTVNGQPFISPTYAGL